MSFLTELADDAAVASALFCAAMIWLLMKKVAVAYDHADLWDWADILGALCGALVMFPVLVIALPSNVKVIYHSIYRAGSVAVALMLQFVFLSLWIENEGRWSIPASLEPSATRFNEGDDD